MTDVTVDAKGVASITLREPCSATDAVDAIIAAGFPIPIRSIVDFDWDRDTLTVSFDPDQKRRREALRVTFELNQGRALN